MLSLYDIAENKTNGSIAYFKKGTAQVHCRFVFGCIVFGDIEDQITINGKFIKIKPLEFDYAYYMAGTIHRTNGPALINNNSKQWWVNDMRHRLDGPAVEWSNGSLEWWINDLRHRLDGPAIEWGNGNLEWWINGKRLSYDKERMLNTWYENRSK